jgi:hypothetical protein
MAVSAPFGRMFDFHEAAEFLGMPEKRLRRLVATRKIPVLRDGRLAFLENDLRTWIEQHRTPAAEGASSPHIELPRPRAEPVGIDDLLPRRRRLMG